MSALTERHDSKRDLRASLLAICIVGILAVGAVFQIFNVTETTGAYKSLLDLSIAQRSQVRQVQYLVTKAEASLLRFLVTADDRYLAEFARDRLAATQAAEMISRLFPDDQTQQARSTQVSAHVISRLEDLSGLMDQPLSAGSAAGAAGWAGGREVVALLSGAAVMQGPIDSILEVERAQITLASRSVDAQLRRSRAITVFLMCSILVLVTGAALAVLANLCRRNQVEQQLHDARRQAEAANRAKSDFLASMSHEIRTPLTSIIGYADLLIDDRLTSAQKKFVSRLRASSATLLALINDVLDFSKIEAGEIAIQPGPVSLDDIVGDVLSIAGVEAERKGVALVREVDPAVPDRVLADGQRLRQVLLNLTTNAVKFTAVGSVTVRVTVPNRGYGRGDMVRIEVIDTGVGIASDKQDKLFRRFSQVDSSIQRVYGGTGLGLAIARSMVVLMGGEIGVDSEPGRGSTFWVELPLPALDGDAESAATEASVDGSAPLRGGARILLVEDSLQNQELVTVLLRGAGYRIDVANDGEEALAALARRRYDLVLMDMQMPRMDGLEATRRIRSLAGPQASVPVIALTANVLSEHLARFREAGANAHVSKPFRKAALLEAIGRLLHTPSEGSGGCGPEVNAVPAVASIAFLASSAPSAATPSAEPVLDWRALTEARSLMGDAWVRACLARLDGDIDALLAAGGGAASDEMHRRAHRMVADAGQLGFARLSARCAELDEACQRGLDAAAAYQAARSAALAARARIVDPLLEGPRFEAATGQRHADRQATAAPAPIAAVG